VKSRLLVVSSVHSPDDPRIRHKLIKTLQDDWDITFAGVGRGPTDQRGIRWSELTGGRLWRSLRAARRLLGRRYDVASVHDPELLPAAIVASFLGRTIVFDVHENVPAQFRPVFPNYLAGEPQPLRDVDPAVGIIYLGDVTEARGLVVAVEAAGAAGAGVFTIMGRCNPDFRIRLNELAATWNMKLEFHGFVTPDEALRITASGSLGLSPLLDTPNYRESLPTKVLEYLAVGIPTLASDLPGTRSVVGDKPGVVLVPPGDVGEWRDAIRDSLDDPGLRAAARRGAPAIMDTYVWPADAVREFYGSLVSA